jgi:hypothetical protein
MTIEELKHKHFIIPDEAYMASDRHTKLSIGFTISILEGMKTNWKIITEFDKIIENKIQELKQQLQNL